MGPSLEVVKLLGLSLGSKYEMGWKLEILEVLEGFKGRPYFRNYDQSPILDFGPFDSSRMNFDC